MHKLDDKRLKYLTDRTNRGNGQTQFLYDLLNGDFENLKALENKIRNCFLFYCPGNKEEIMKIMVMKQDRNLDLFVD